MRKLLVVVGALLLFAAPAAFAQTSTTYPPPTTTTTAAPEEEETEVVTTDLSNLDEGESVTLRSCGFGEEPVVTFNSSLVHESDELGPEGCATQLLTVIEDGEPDAALGGPRLAAIGAPLHLAQANPDPLVEIDGQRFVARGNRRTNVVRNTGFDSDGEGLREVRHIFTLGRPGDDGRGALARTGATVVRWGLPGVALLGVGTLMVLAARRRRAA